MSDSVFIPEPRSVRVDAMGPPIEHLNGVPHYEAPLPRRWHRCWVQTRGWIGFGCVERCACGAIRRGDGISRRERRWMERNTGRRRGDIPDTPFIERKQAQVDELDDLVNGLLERTGSDE